MDDPLSACDARVADKIMRHCFLDFLSAKTRVMATHSQHFYKHFDRIYHASQNTEQSYISWVNDSNSHGQTHLVEESSHE